MKRSLILYNSLLLLISVKPASQFITNVRSECYEIRKYIHSRSVNYYHYYYIHTTITNWETSNPICRVIMKYLSTIQMTPGVCVCVWKGLTSGYYGECTTTSNGNWHAAVNAPSYAVCHQLTLYGPNFCTRFSTIIVRQVKSVCMCVSVRACSLANRLLNLLCIFSARIFQRWT